MNRFLHILAGTLLSCAALWFTSCTMIEDDISDCPTGLYVRFVYDYNTARADMFKDHVGYVTLYVYDEDGKKVAERSVANTDSHLPLNKYGYAMHFTPQELPAGHRYRLQAVAMQKDWDEALKTPGAKYRRTEVSDTSSLKISLDRSDYTIDGTELHEVSNEAPLDTLWHTLKVMSYAPQDGKKVPPMQKTQAPYSIYPIDDQLVSVAKDRATYATVSLIRDTKHLNITLRQIDDPDNIFDNNYEVTIIDNNAILGPDNSVVTTDSIRYTPYEHWTTRFDNNGIIIDSGTETGNFQRTAHYDIMFNRLIFDSSNSNNSAMLRIRNLNSGKTVALINLPYILAEGRTAYETYNYTPQEYLDREYDYRLNFFLKGDSWAYCDIVVNVLSWSRRLQNVEF